MWPLLCQVFHTLSPYSFFEYKPDVMKGFKTNLFPFLNTSQMLWKVSKPIYYPLPTPHPNCFYYYPIQNWPFCVNSFNHWVTDNIYLPNENIPTYLYKCMGAGIWIEINFLALTFSGKNWAPFYDLCFKPILTIFLSYYLNSGFYMNVMLLLVAEVFLITLSVLRFVVFNQDTKTKWYVLRIRFFYVFSYTERKNKQHISRCLSFQVIEYQCHHEDQNAFGTH